MADPTEALARVLLEYAISDDRTHAITHHEQAERIVADPGPLLEALAEAGVLLDEHGQKWHGGFGMTPSRVPMRRYVTDWQEADRA